MSGSMEGDTWLLATAGPCLTSAKYLLKHKTRCI